MALGRHTLSTMHDFERYAIEFMIGDGVIAPDVRRQLAYTTVSRRTRDPDQWVTHLAVDPAAPRISPSDAEISADLDVDAYGTMTASLTISDGHLAALAFEMPGLHWPERPRILGLVPYPQP